MVVRRGLQKRNSFLIELLNIPHKGQQLAALGDVRSFVQLHAVGMRAGFQLYQDLLENVHRLVVNPGLDDVVGKGNLFNLLLVFLPHTNSTVSMAHDLIKDSPIV